jgi:hypothetical protein
MLRRALVVWLAFLLLAHGIAHVPGFLVNWQIASFPDLTYRTTIFATSVDVGPEGIRLIGLCWIGTAVVLVVLASAVAFNVPLPAVGHTRRADSVPAPVRGRLARSETRSGRQRRHCVVAARDVS